MIPKDPNMLLSYINTGLRDRYEDLGDMASSEGFDEAEIRERLGLPQRSSNSESDYDSNSED